MMGEWQKLGGGAQPDPHRADRLEWQQLRAMMRAADDLERLYWDALLRLAFELMDKRGKP